MTHTEYDCLNSIRYGMKMYLRWVWDLDILEWQDVHDAMSYIEDVLWEQLARNPVKILREDD